MWLGPGPPLASALTTRSVLANTDITPRHPIIIYTGTVVGSGRLQLGTGMLGE